MPSRLTSARFDSDKGGGNGKRVYLALVVVSHFVPRTDDMVLGSNPQTNRLFRLVDRGLHNTPGQQPGLGCAVETLRLHAVRGHILHTRSSTVAECLSDGYALVGRLSLPIERDLRIKETSHGLSVRNIYVLLAQTGLPLWFAPIDGRPGLVGGSPPWPTDQAGQRQRRHPLLSGSGGWRARGFRPRLLHGLPRLGCTAPSHRAALSVHGC